MKRHLSPAVLAAIFAMAGPSSFAFAQETAPDAAKPESPAVQSEAPAAESTATTPAETPAPATETPAPAAQAAKTDEAQVGAYYVKETHGDWTLRCIKTEEARDPCELYQLMKDGDGTAVAEMTIVPLLEGGKAVAGSTIVAPLETDLIQGLAFRVDSGESRGYPFGFCAPVGCVSRLGFTAAELATMKKGGKGFVSLLPYGGDPKSDRVELNLSLSGFTAGYDALSTLMAELKK